MSDNLTEATYTPQQIRDAIKRVYEYDDATDFAVDRGMLATMLDQQQREIERLRNVVEHLHQCDGHIYSDRVLGEIVAIGTCTHKAHERWDHKGLREAGLL